MWQTGNKEVFSNSQKALEYVQALHIGNYNDWRLPSKEELYNLYQIYEMKLSGNCPIKLKGSYWLTEGDIHAGEWEAYPICGGSELQYFNATDGRIMAVRP